MNSAVAVQALAAAQRPRSGAGSQPSDSRATTAQPAASVSCQGSMLVECGWKVAHRTCGTPASPARPSTFCHVPHSCCPALLPSSRPDSFRPVRIACRKHGAETKGVSQLAASTARLSRHTKAPHSARTQCAQPSTHALEPQNREAAAGMAGVEAAVAQQQQQAQQG